MPEVPVDQNSAEVEDEVSDHWNTLCLSDTKITNTKRFRQFFEISAKIFTFNVAC